MGTRRPRLQFPASRLPACCLHATTTATTTRAPAIERPRARTSACGAGLGLPYPGAATVSARGRPAARAQPTLHPSRLHLKMPWMHGPAVDLSGRPRGFCACSVASPVGRREDQIREKQKQKPMHKGPCVQVCGLLHANRTRLRQLLHCCP
jgi:hypothetical protein